MRITIKKVNRPFGSISLKHLINIKLTPIPIAGLLLLSVFLLQTGCTSNYYITARQLHSRGNYVGAIENYDEFIARTPDGAMRVKALNNRSEAYYQMADEQMERGNYRLAIRLFYLSNSLKADEKLVESHLAIAGQAYQEEDFDRIFNTYNYIINTFPLLPATPYVVYRRLKLHHNLEHDIDHIWNDFLILVDRYMDEEQIENARPIIDQYLPGLVEEAVNLKESESYEAAIDQLIHLKSYPHSFQEKIESEIGLLYYEKGDMNKQEEDFFEAYDNYLLAKEYNPGLSDRIDSKFEAMVIAIVDYGNGLLEERKIDEAFEVFELSFRIIPGNELATESIRRTEQLAENIRQADNLFQQALQYEEDENYEEALRLYRQSWNLDRLPRTEDKIFLMTNLIEIEEDPVGFARTIISEYNNGIIMRNIDEITTTLEAIDGDSVRTSGWRVLLSTGTHRYEVRYDITSRSQSYYLIWQVNLLNRNIVPLNRHSEEVMGLS